MSQSLVTRARRFVSGGEFSFREKLSSPHAHPPRASGRTLRRRVRRALLIGWYSMVVRTSGEVGPCCILQGKPLGNVYTQSLSEVWNGEPYEAFRRDLHCIMRRGADWEASGDDQFVERMCGGRTLKWPISNLYFRTDVAFMRDFQQTLAFLG